MADILLPLEIAAQPDDTTCGPTCLHAVYRFFGESPGLHDVIGRVPSLRDGGTLAVSLALDALRQGYRATIYTYNLQLFDPSWFSAEVLDLRDKLRRQARLKDKQKLQYATDAYLEYLARGGRVEFVPLTRALIRDLLLAGHPILTGLSATYLYREPREIPATNKPDDVAGLMAGHFVVLCGYREATEEVLVADPLHANPFSSTRKYNVAIDVALGAILLGVITYDANLLVIEPAARP